MQKNLFQHVFYALHSLTHSTPKQSNILPALPFVKGTNFFLIRNPKILTPTRKANRTNCSHIENNS